MMQQPDADGHKIPMDTTHGSAVLSGASGYSEWINVGVSVGIFNVSTATCGTTCPTCFGYTDFRVQADTGTAPVGQDTQFSSWAFSQNNIWQNVTLQSFWSSSNIQLAKPSGSTVGAFTGVSPGSFNANANANLIDYPADCAGNGSPCPFTNWPGSASGTITPPGQLLVIGDTTTFGTNCPNTKVRILAYQIQDSNGRDVTANIQTREQFGSKSQNTCNTTIITAETCSGTLNGIIHDTLTVGCNSVDNGCGYTYTNQQWVWCASTPTVIGTVGDLVVHDNAISVGGSFTSIKGKVIKP